MIRVTSIAKKDFQLPVSPATWKLLSSILFNGKFDSVLPLHMFLHYQRDGFNMFFSSLFFWVGFSCWTCVDEWSFMMSCCLMPQAASVRIRQFWQCPPRKFFSHFLLYFLPLISHLPSAALSIEITLSLTLPLVQSTLFVFSKSKNWQDCVR